ncbi:MAG: cysteine desulfurase [Candidatus Latescibacteria bacterium]|nr:cysteine desulfurase [Candidatus Latescibacterota bacterium]
MDVERLRRDFPILSQRVRNKPLVYLDNGATTQKPQSVIDALVGYYTTENANIHRGVHYLSQQATFAYERTRGRIRRFLNAADNSEIVFVRGTTEGINLVAQSFARPRLHEGDEIIVSQMEHHSNIVPWQMVCAERGARLRVIPVDDAGELILEEYEKLLNPRTKLVAVAHASNVLGTINPVARITALAHQHGVPVLVDGAQGIPHLPADVRELGCDFYVFSGHKIFGPTGIGVLYGRRELLESMPPYQGGGSMIVKVSFEGTTYAELPNRFEAGTPHIAGAIGLEAAIDYLNEAGQERLAAYETELLGYATQALSQVKGLRVFGTARDKVGVLSFAMESAHPHDIGTVLDSEGIAIRAGHHCAQPLMQRYGVPAMARASLAFYNTREEIDALVDALLKVNEVFA